MSVLVEGSAESVSSVYLRKSDLCWFVDRLREWAEWSVLVQDTVRAMAVVEVLELAECVERDARVTKIVWTLRER
jgi:hypothetical protein